MLIRILGEVAVATGDGWQRAGPPKRACVLAALAISPGAAVSLPVLARRVWGAAVPVSVDSTLYGHIARLRALLRQCPQPVEIRTCGPDGYLLDVDPALVDLHAARRLAGQARGHADRGDAIAAAGTWRAADAVMREPVLTGVDGEWAAELRTTVHNERSGLLAELYRAELDNARHESIVTELLEHVAAYPLAEGLTESLMIALYRCDRQTEALEQYHGLRQRLRDERGVEPGKRLHRLHRRILNHDPDLEADTSPAAAPEAPAQLPAAPHRLTGRDAQLAALDAAAADGTGPAVWTISGPGGIGKSWLALHWGRRHRETFSHGQLYLNLHGFDGASDPVTPEIALRDLLQGLGVPPTAIPAGLDAMASKFRDLTGDRKLLIVIDDARDSSQVIPLLPSGTGCFTVITARSELTGLAATHGARGLRLPELTDAEVHQAFADKLGRHRWEAEPAAAADLVTACAGLPLAVGIVAAQAASRPQAPLAALAETMRDATQRLDVLDGDELSASLRAVLAASIAPLSPQAARMFALLGTSPGHDIGHHALASLTATDPAAAHAALRELRTVGLVDEPLPRRYRMHDLTRLYAMERARVDLDEPRRTAGLRRLVDHYLHTGSAARLLMQPATRARNPGPPAEGCVPQPLPDADAATRWFERETGNAIDVQQAAEAAGWDRSVWFLAWTMLTFHVRRQDFGAKLVVWRRALAAARRDRDSEREAFAAQAIGEVMVSSGDHAAGAKLLAEAARLAEANGDVTAEADAHHSMALHYEKNLGDYAQALHHARTALRLTRRNGQLGWQYSVALNSVGWLYAHLGDYGRARRYCQRALGVIQDINPDDPLVGLIHDSLGFTERRAGRLERAREHYTRAVAMLRRSSFHRYWPKATADLADVEQARGAVDEARRLRREAADLYEAQGFGDAAARLRREL